MPTKTVRSKVTVTRQETREYSRAELCKRLNIPEDAKIDAYEDVEGGLGKLVVEFTRTTERKPAVKP